MTDEPQTSCAGGYRLVDRPGQERTDTRNPNEPARRQQNLIIEAAHSASGQPGAVLEHIAHIEASTLGTLEPDQLEHMVDSLLREGVAVLDAATLVGAPDGVLWSAIGDLASGSSRVARRHLSLKKPFRPFEAVEEEFGVERTLEAQLAAITTAGWLAQIAERFVGLGVLPREATASASWSANLTRWDSSENQRLPLHVDWEMLTAVLSPDGSLVTATGQEPRGPAAVFVTGNLCHRFSSGRIVGGEHRISAGPVRRSMQVFYLGNPDVCFDHGLTHACGGSVRDALMPKYALESALPRTKTTTP